MVRSLIPAKAIELGAQIAIDEINARGGVLGGRPLALLTMDNQGLTMRGRDNYVSLAKQQDLDCSTWWQA